MYRTSRCLLLGAILLLVIMPVSTGCSRKAKEDRAAAMAERMMSSVTGQKVEIDPNGKTVRIEGKGVTTTMSQTAEWPADMFAGVPRFTFGRVERVVRGEDGGMKKFNVYLRDIQPGGVERYAQLLERAGWNVERMSTGGQGGILNGQKDDLGLNFPYGGERNDGMLAVYSVKQ
jgi:hypothetical protein